MRALLLAAACLLLAGCGAVLDSRPGRSVTALPSTSAVSYPPQRTYSPRPLPPEYSYRSPAPKPRPTTPAPPPKVTHHTVPYTPPTPPSTRASVAPPAPPAECTPRSPASACGWGCGPALAYLRRYANPIFSLYCPSPTGAWGAQASTCVPLMYTTCPGQYRIDIADPCPIAYRNEASNSWTWKQWVWDRTLAERVADGLDPYGPACP